MNDKKNLFPLIGKNTGSGSGSGGGGGGGSADITVTVPAYSASSTYNTGTVVFYDGKIYVANENGITGAWNPAKWTLTNLAEQLE